MRRTVVTTLSAFLYLTAFLTLPAVAQTHNFWTSGTAVPTPVQFPMTGVINGLIYVVGGYDGTGVITDTKIYNPATGVWTTGTPLPVATAYGTSAVVKNILYIFGGYVTNGSGSTNAVWAYNPKTKTWSSKSPMPTSRGSNGAAVENNIVYVIGGNTDANHLRLTTVESYNPATDTWTEESPLLVGKSEPSVGLVKHSVSGVIVQTIVAADGFTLSGDTGDNEGYNASGNSWTALATDPHTRNVACTGAFGPKLFVASGSPEGSSTTTENDVYNIATNAWTNRASAPQAVAGAGSAVYKGSLYCIGGGNSTSFGDTAFTYVQIYHP